MGQTHVDFLQKLRAKLVEQRRTTAIRQSNPASVEGVDNMTKLQEAIEAVDRAILDEQRLP